MAEDRKFKFENGQFVNRKSGEAIPVDEPVILFRARDRHAYDVLRAYLTMASDPHHREAIKDMMALFADYQQRHPDRMKEPGITRDIDLLADAQPKTHPLDAVIVGDLPNTVIDEEGFKIAAFRFYLDAESFVTRVNAQFPCALYEIERRVSRIWPVPDKPKSPWKAWLARGHARFRGR
jgi:hypothetical protein